MMWVANHRLHHARSDQEGDPHSPRDGSWWSHAFWLAYKVGGKDQAEYFRKWAPDLYQDRYIRMSGLRIYSHQRRSLAVLCRG
jgi:fatty-acid desaturase